MTVTEIDAELEAIAQCMLSITENGEAVDLDGVRVQHANPESLTARQRYLTSLRNRLVAPSNARLGGLATVASVVR